MAAERSRKTFRKRSRASGRLAVMYFSEFQMLKNGSPTRNERRNPKR